MTTDAATIERAIDDAKTGRTTVEAMLATLLDGNLVVPSGGAVEPDGSGFQPVLFDKEGTPMVATFTAKERIGSVASLAPYALALPARDFLNRVPTGHGVVVNPGHDAGFELDPGGLQRLIGRAQG